jgi:hypothetical protein
MKYLLILLITTSCTCITLIDTNRVVHVTKKMNSYTYEAITVASENNVKYYIYFYYDGECKVDTGKDYIIRERRDRAIYLREIKDSN